MVRKVVVLVGLSAMALSGAVGCASARPTAMQEGIATMRRESEPDELAKRGEAFAALGDMTRAEQYFVAALKSGGEPGGLVRRLIAVCVADGRYPAALEYAEDYLRNHPGDVDVRYVAATVRAALGDTDGARSGLRQVLAAQPGLADVHYALAQLERTSGDVMAADAEYRKYLGLAPDGPRAEVARANLMQAVPQ